MCRTVCAGLRDGSMPQAGFPTSLPGFPTSLPGFPTSLPGLSVEASLAGESQRATNRAALTAEDSSPPKARTNGEPLVL